jgi:hypothetical protein
MERFSIEITLDAEGVRGVRVFGKDWEHGAAAYALLRRVGPVIQQLDALAKSSASFDQALPSRPEGIQ